MNSTGLNQKRHNSAKKRNSYVILGRRPRLAVLCAIFCASRSDSERRPSTVSTRIRPLQLYGPPSVYGIGIDRLESQPWLLESKTFLCRSGHVRAIGSTLTLFRNKRLSKGKKGVKKRTVDPFSRKDEYNVKVRLDLFWRN